MKAHKLREEVFPVEVGRQRLERIATLEGTLRGKSRRRLELGGADVEVVPVRLQTAPVGGQ
jgi:hypothetical protein